MTVLLTSLRGITGRLMAVVAALSTVLIATAIYAHGELRAIKQLALRAESNRVPQLTRIAQVELNVTRVSLQLRHAMLARTPAEQREAFRAFMIARHLRPSEWARAAGVRRFFYSSSACVYAADKQTGTQVSLKEPDAYPAMPEDGYGWEKLFSERMCRHFLEDYGLQTRVARYHNVFGPHTLFDGGREKAPAALSRKVAQAKLSGRHEIEIWGDGEQTRSFLFIDDCLDGTLALAASDVAEPLNVGSEGVNAKVRVGGKAFEFPEPERIFYVPQPTGARCICRSAC